jgi:hypothetical protein
MIEIAGGINAMVLPHYGVFIAMSKKQMMNIQHINYPINNLVIKIKLHFSLTIETRFYLQTMSLYLLL